MKLLFTLFSCAFLCFIVSAQAPNIVWKQTFGGSGLDQATSIEQTKDSGYIVAGGTTSNDGDVSGNHGGTDGWVIKLNKTQGVQWKYAYGASGDEWINSIHQTTDSGYIIAGYTTSSTMSGYQGTTDFWVVRLDKNGMLLWQRALGGTAIDIANSIRQTTDGGFIVAGVSASNDGDLPVYQNGNDYWIVKLTNTGSIEWQKVLGGFGDDAAYDICQTTDGGYVVAGHSKSFDYDFPLNQGGFDIYVVKLTNTGSVTWKKNLGGSLDDVPRSIAPTSDGGYILAAGTRSSNGDVTGARTSMDYWIVKLRTTGSIQWQKTFGGNGYDLANSVKQTSDGGYVVAGFTESTSTAIENFHGVSDYWMLRLSDLGILKWQVTLGGNQADQATAVDTTTDGKYIVAGYTYSNTNDVSGNHGSGDFWVAKFANFNFHAFNRKNEASSRYSIAQVKNSNVQTDGSQIEIKVAADNSNATLIAFTGDNPLKKDLEILQHPEVNNSYTAQYGQLTEIKRTSDSLIYIYHHPQYVVNGNESKFVEYQFRLKDRDDNHEYVAGKLKIYHTPLLMVHGVWSSIKAFKKMQDYILQYSNNYEPYQLLRAWFSSPNHKEAINAAYTFRYKIPKSIDSLLEVCRNQKLSAGKVNIVGHSRGGLFARYYLQGNYVSYDSDVNCLITINTPHAGAQTANLTLDERTILGVVKINTLFKQFALKNEGEDGSYKDDIDGAYELRVDDSTMLNFLNAEQYLNKNHVPSHAITSKYSFNGSRSDLLKQVYVNGGTVGLLLARPVVGNLAVFLRLYALLMGTNCIEGPLDDCVREIFNGETSDLVVPTTSQRGGLPANAITSLTGSIAHSKKEVEFLDISAPGVVELQQTQNRVIQLLRQNPNSSDSFTTAGFKPRRIYYDFLPNLTRNPNASRLTTGDSLSINDSINRITYSYGDTALVSVTSSVSVKNILVTYGSSSLKEMESDIKDSNNYSFNFPIPKDAIGKIEIIGYGFNNNSLIALDTSFINVAPPANVTLDSIKISRDAGDSLYVYAGDSTRIDILGYYSDTVRIISSLPNINYSIQPTNIATIIGDGYLKGTTPNGVTLLKVNYLNKRDSVLVHVRDSIINFKDLVPTTITSIANGNWSDTTIWSNHKVPDENAYVIIATEVKVDVNAACRNVKVQPAAKLTVNAGKKLDVDTYFH